MQLKALILAAFVSGLAGQAEAQSLSPMRNEGSSPSDIKGFRLTVGNPYPQRMTFVLVPMEPGFSRVAEGARANPSELILAPGHSRQVVFAFHLPETQKERTIGLCVYPKNIEGPVLPRVCGTYRGWSIGKGS
jgi:hypothetical protein